MDEIWICDAADGANAFQLTSFGKGMSGSPRWSPDGKTIAFDSNVSGNWDIWVIPREGGRPKRLTTNPANDAMPSWSRDSQWIYFVSTRSEGGNVWKIRLDGTSETQITFGGAFIGVPLVVGLGHARFSSLEMLRKGFRRRAIPIVRAVSGRGNRWR